MAVIITQIIHCCYDAGQEVVPESVLVMLYFVMHVGRVRVKCAQRTKSNYVCHM